MLQIMLGDVNSLSNATHHWIELFVAQLLYIRPLTVVSSHSVFDIDEFAYSNTGRALCMWSMNLSLVAI